MGDLEESLGEPQNSLRRELSRGEQVKHGSREVLPASALATPEYPTLRQAIDAILRRIALKNHRCVTA